MNLLQICQPLISYICEINRIARNKGNLEYDIVRSNIRKLFERMYDQVINDMELTAEIDKIKFPLIFFVDYSIKEGPFSFNDQWEELGKEYNELSGDEKFFDLLDENLNDPSAAATERLRVFYQCLGVGFNGCYHDDPDLVERKMRVCALRIGIDSEMPLKEKITASCYENVRQQDRFRDPVKLIKRIFLAAVIILIVSYIANVIMFYAITLPMQRSLDHCLSPVTQDSETSRFLNIRRLFQVFVTDKNAEKETFDSNEDLKKRKPEQAKPGSEQGAKPPTQAPAPEPKVNQAELNVLEYSEKTDDEQPVAAPRDVEKPAAGLKKTGKPAASPVATPKDNKQPVTKPEDDKQPAVGSKDDKQPAAKPATKPAATPEVDKQPAAEPSPKRKQE